MQLSRSTVVFKAFIPLLLTSNLLLLYPHHRLMLLAVFLYLLPSLPPLIPLEFFNGMLAIFNPGAFNHYTLFGFILLTLFIYRNPTLIHFLLSGSLDSLLCYLITPTPGLAFYLPIPRTLSAASSFSSSRAYPSLIFLPLLSVC